MEPLSVSWDASAAPARRLFTLARHVAPLAGGAHPRHAPPQQQREQRQRSGSADSAAPAVPLRRCAAAAAFSAAAAAGASAADSSLSVAEIKAALEAANIDYRDCLEKKELLQRLADAREGLPPAAAARLDAALLRRAATSAEAAPPATSAAPPSSLNSSLLDEEANTVALFKRCAPSVVHIRTSAVARTPFSQDATEIPQGAGTGIVWDADGHIVTNFHVIKGMGLAPSASSLTFDPPPAEERLPLSPFWFGAPSAATQEAQRAKVTLADNSTWEARLVGYEADKDLAVLRIGDASGRAPPALRPIAVGTSAALQVGQRTFAIGNPFGLDQTLTSGIVSGVGRDIKSLTGRTIRDVVQTDAAINPGNSGGPLLDSRGRLIGVNTVIYSPSGASAGVGFAIPVDTVRRVVNSLIRNKGRVIRAGLGVHCAADAQAKQLGLPGVLVIDVAPGSGAAAAGLRGTARDARDGSLVLGDVITGVNGTKVGSVEDLLAAVEEKTPGESVALTLLRDGRERNLQVTLQQRADVR